MTKPDLSAPSLSGLAWLLRHPNEWPANFSWDFNHVSKTHSCGTSGCAIGVALLMWPELTPKWEWSSGQFEDVFHMSDWEFENIFFDNEIYGVPFSEVTPEMVADKIDEYLERK